MLSMARCMMSELAELGRPRVEEETRPENIDGLEIPVAKR